VQEIKGGRGGVFFVCVFQRRYEEKNAKLQIKRREGRKKEKKSNSG
jgi:hypothetical protein